MTKVALIDIGSNSIRMVLYQIDAQRQYHELERYRHFVQLAKDMTAAGEINTANFQSGIAALRQFQQIINQQQVDQVIATATEAIRQAKNKQDFIQAAWQQAQIKIRVLSGKQEAAYDALAIQTDLQLQNFLFLDTGGGSFEMGAVGQQELLQAGSWPFGAVKLYDSLHAPTQLSSTQIKKVQQHLQQGLQQINSHNMRRLVVIGGVHRTLFTIMDQPAAHWLSAAKVNSWVQLIQQNSLAQNLTLEHMETQRAPFMPAGLLPLKTIIDYFAVQQICFSKAGLRNGILQEYLEQISLDSIPG
ncbi:Ppx/GppA phosphatase family protein [Bombilactobacillus bombi]|uniref:Ppx/GppA phosphatase family protein n=1 Tax=Bombilactobacillus bombi TaxID=1303590 RepID=UPI0015E5DA8D|nr:hypothetical protein [Bombilactobacillus bombi]